MKKILKQTTRFIFERNRRRRKGDLVYRFISSSIENPLDLFSETVDLSIIGVVVVVVGVRE